MNITFTPKKDAKELTKQLQQLNRQPQQKPSYKYLDKETLDRHMAELHDMEFRRLATKDDLAACNEAGRAFTYAVAHVDRYALLMARIDISKDQVLKAAYKNADWDNLPEGIKNQIRRAARKYMQHVNQQLKELTDFTERHASYLNQVTDEEHVEMLLDLESTELDLKVVRSFRTYIKQGETKEAYWQTAEGLCEQLSILSKGLLYLTPQKLADRLKKAGYRHEERMHGRHRVRFFYVELVK